MNIILPGETLEDLTKMAAEVPERAAALAGSFIYHMGLLQKKWPIVDDVPADLREFLTDVFYAAHPELKV